MKKKEFLRELRVIYPKYNTRSYLEWKQRVNKEPETLEHKARNGNTCQVKITTHWYNRKGGLIKITFAIDNGGWRFYFPVTISKLVTPYNEYL